MTDSKKSSAPDELSLLDISSENQDIKNKVQELLEKLEHIDFLELEAEITLLLQNMMNFFSLHTSEIPRFESLSPEQQRALLMRFQSLTNSLLGRKIKSSDELIQVFVFTVLSAIGEAIPQSKEISAIEIMNKKHGHSFREFLKRAAQYEIYKITNPKRIAGETNEENFINNAVVLGVKKAMKYAGVEFESKKINHNSLKILEEAHLNFKRNGQLLKK